MPRTPLLIAAGAAAVVIAVVGGLLLYPRSAPSVGTAPTTTPAASIESARAGGSPSLTPLSLGGDVAFTRTIDGNTDVYLTSDGTRVERLTTNPAEDLQIAWSPDRSSLLIGRRTSSDPELSDIYALDLATRVETRLTSGGGRHANPVLSPDGTRIAYDRSPAEAGFHVMDLHGANDRLVYPINDDQWNLQSSWASNRALYAKHGDFDLVVVDVETGKTTGVVSGGQQLGDVTLSPDRSTFAFRSGRDGGGVYLMNIDGSNVRRVVQSTPNGGLSWAPDGKHLILGQPDGWLYVVDLDGQNLTRWIEGADPAPRPTG